MKIKIEDFEINSWYGFHTADGRTVTGIVALKYQTETFEKEEHILRLYVSEENYIDLKLEDVTDYWSYEIGEDDFAKEIRLYDEELVDYDIQLGETVTEILKSYMHNWDDYDDETRKMLASKVRGLVTTDVLVDILTAFVDTKKNYKEECDKHLKVLDNQVEFVKKYSEFKSILPDGIAEIYDIILFDICGLDLG